MDVSIVIVSYNVKEYIISCIESIYKHTKRNIDFEIIVVDNNSSDGSSKKIAELFPNVNLIQNNKNYGFSRASNYGASFSKGHYILFLNPDTIFIEDNFIFNLIELFKRKRNIGAIGPALLNTDGIIQQSFWRYPTFFNTTLSVFQLDFLNKVKNYRSRKFNNLTQVDSISGAALIIKGQILNQFNGFNENLFWMEDVDLCKRLNEANLPVFYSPKNKIIHFSGRSSKKDYKIKISNQLMSKIVYFKTHHSIITTFLIFLVILFSVTIKSIVFFMLTFLGTKYRMKLSAYLFTLKSILSLDWQQNRFSQID